ncbi:hypothetical protein SAMN04487936_105118 [Halobacillus dabanensis]|uniref:Uncharacterized protein n=1 Tax=Halobacillus dabanensis TaxID=240302 RepID=A0A1I3V2G5_HALDA|nr:hypothetical protein [Halobacillus dabanensis]SFJ89874.1 hypothetical protein SAMN04487936_105118 [Halobacillus dabanensis]
MCKRKWLLFLFIIFVAGCNANAEAEGPTEVVPVENGEIEIKAEDQTSEKEKKLQLTIEEESYPFLYKDFPILSQYVHNYDRPEEKLRQLPFTRIKDDRYLVEFACHENRCSHLMIDFKEKHSFLMSDLSTLIESQISPDQQFIAFLFERTQEDTKKHQLIVMDLDRLTPVELEAGADHLLPKPNQYQYTIQSVTFMDEEKLKIISEDPMADGENKESISSLWVYQ